jgi:hypothetical protein
LPGRRPVLAVEEGSVLDSVSVDFCSVEQVEYLLFLLSGRTGCDDQPRECRARSSCRRPHFQVGGLVGPHCSG